MEHLHSKVVLITGGSGMSRQAAQQCADWRQGLFGSNAIKTKVSRR